VGPLGALSRDAKKNIFIFCHVITWQGRMGGLVRTSGGRNMYVRMYV
jgi:hypothetical protein